MKSLLRNPVYHSLLSDDSHLGIRHGNVLAFDESVSPFAGFEEGYANGFSDLYNWLPAGRSILYATPQVITVPAPWKLSAFVEGLQFLYEGGRQSLPSNFVPTPLTVDHVPQMMELAALTRPGPFGTRTIEFGNYHGVFENGRLAAMTGQRLHVENYTEISAVCTHPNFLGKGYASALVQHQVALILEQQQVPFLHVRADNQRAISVYERLGFVAQGPMNFYFLKKQ